MNSEQGAKPNIVLVLMDNLGWGELGVYGGGILRGAPTPRLDRLAGEGFRALNFNVEAQCTPSRAALMTGLYAVRTRQRHGAAFIRELRIDPMGSHALGNAGPDRLRHGCIRQMASRRHTGAFSTRPGIRRMGRDTESSASAESFWPQSSRLRFRLESTSEIRARDGRYVRAKRPRTKRSSRSE